MSKDTETLIKRTLAKVMALALTVSMAGVSASGADAAKKIKLSKKSISVAKGTTKKVTIKNVKAKKVKKLTVKSANKKIAAVKKAGKTAFKITGKKAGKSTKVTVKVTVKGKKKAAELTLKVKVTKASKKKVVVTAAPATTAPSATPAASASAPATSASATPAAPIASAPAEDSKNDPLKVKIDPSTQSSIIQDSYYADAVFYKEGAYSFTSIDDYNTGLGISVNENASFANVSQYKYVKVILDCETEVAVNLYDSSAESYWNKADVYEGNGADGAVVTDKDKLTGLRAVYVPLERFAEKTDLEELACVSVNPNGKKGAKITVYSIEFTNTYVENEKIEVPETLTAYETKPNVPEPDTSSTETSSTETSSTETSSTETSSSEILTIEVTDAKQLATYGVTMGGIEATVNKDYGYVMVSTKDVDISKYTKVRIYGSQEGITVGETTGSSYNWLIGKVFTEDTADKGGISLNAYDSFKNTNGVFEWDLSKVDDLKDVTTITGIGLSDNGSYGYNKGKSPYKFKITKIELIP